VVIIDRDPLDQPADVVLIILLYLPGQLVQEFLQFLNPALITVR
jgi:hypothetical protein